MRGPPELVRLDRLDPRWCIDLRYATPENFTGRRLYSRAEAWLRPETAAKLSAARDRLSDRSLRLRVLDAYRPPSAQRALWAALPDERFVAPPERGSRHTRGTAVDVTLLDAAGRELEMPSAFDEFGGAGPPGLERHHRVGTAGIASG
jgi:D-alanyl-D-alanine dipeptidase